MKIKSLKNYKWVIDGQYGSEFFQGNKCEVPDDKGKIMIKYGYAEEVKVGRPEKTKDTLVEENKVIIPEENKIKTSSKKISVNKIKLLFLKKIK